MVAMVARLRQQLPGALAPRTFVALRKGLVNRAARIDRLAAAGCVLESGARILSAERRRVQRWRLRAHGFRAVAAGLESIVRAARRARGRAVAHPTVDNHHAWRRRVKDHWFQVRLLEGRCGDELIAWQQGLEALDGCLGEHHDCVLVQQVLVGERLLPRDETAGMLRLLRGYQRALRRDAHNLAAQLYAETPRQVVRRVRRLWRTERHAAAAAETRASWPRAA
jgi:hypothetical protein